MRVKLKEKARHEAGLFLLHDESNDHSINSFTVGPDGGLYFQEGTFHHTQVESPFGIARSANAGSFRFEPRTGKFDLYTAVGYANPHGHVFDLYGTDILHDGTGSNPYDAALISGRNTCWPDRTGWGR